MLLLKSHAISQDLGMFILFAILYATGMTPKLVSVYYTCMHICVYMYNGMIFYCCCVTEISCAGCPTRYRTRHFFNNSNTNENIATKFEQHTL